MISVFSVVMGVLWLNVALVMLLLLRKCENFTVNYSSKLLLLLAMLALLRILLPLDFRQALVIRSYVLLPAIVRALQKSVGGVLERWQLVLLLWSAGSLIAAAVEGCGLLIDRHKRRTYREIDGAQAKQAAREIGFPPERVIVSPDVKMPMAGGFFKPRIYIPDMELKEKDYRWILLHERSHIRHGDTWVKLFYLALQVIFWWNPIIYLFQNELDSIQEFRCDQTVVKGRTQADRVSYADTVSWVAGQICEDGRPKRYRAGITTFARAKTTRVSQQRIEAILYPTPRPKGLYAVLAALCVTIFAASYFVLVQTAVQPPAEELFPITSENSYVVHTEDNKYELWTDGEYIECFDESDLLFPPLCDLEIQENINGG